MATYVNLSSEDRRALYTVDELFSYFNRFNRGATFVSKCGNISPEEMNAAIKVVDILLRAKEIEVVK